MSEVGRHARRCLPADRARPPQVLLGVGAVLLVSAGAAVASAYGGLPGPAAAPRPGRRRGLVLAPRRPERAAQLRGDPRRVRGRARASPASDLGGPRSGRRPGAGRRSWPRVFLVLHRVAPTTAAWPLASWAAAQLAVLRALDAVPDALRTEPYLCVALVGLGIALFGRRVVARARAA